MSGINKIIHTIGYASIAIALAGVVFAGIRINEDHSAWFNYTEIRSQQEVWPLGAHPTMISVNDIRRVPVSMKWTDVLRCDLDSDDGGELFFSVYPSEFKQTKLRGLAEGDWVYNAQTPTEPATCFLDSTTCAETIWGDKCQQVLSDEFRFE